METTNCPTRPKRQKWGLLSQRYFPVLTPLTPALGIAANGRDTRLQNKREDPENESTVQNTLVALVARDCYSVAIS